MQQYQTLLKRILIENAQEDGVHFDRETRSGDVASIFGANLEFDMRKGFPIVTTKRVPFKAVAGELLWFLNGERTLTQLKHRTELSEDAWTIWTQDCERAFKENPKRFDGENIGELYPVMWRNKRIAAGGAVLVTIKEDLDKDYKVVGKATVSIEGVNDVGSIKDEHKKIYRLWQDMLIRCYGNRPQHRVYRLNKVTVSPRWKVFSNFLKDVYQLSGFQEWVDNPANYCLDKDYFGSNVYSRNTTIFLEKEINSMLNGGGQGLQVFKVDDTVLFGLSNLADYCGTYRQHKLLDRLEKLGVTIEKLPTQVGKSVWRPKIFIDQISDLIDGIKTNPMSRYHIVDSWNPEYKDKAVLGACHTGFQVFVTTDGFMDLQWTQRSADAFLGVPFNIASYGMLLTILAAATGYRPRYLRGSFGDVHIYEKHFEQVVELLGREPMMLPRLKLPKVFDKGDFFEYIKGTASDFELLDYVSHPAIKAPLLVGKKEENNESTDS